MADASTNGPLYQARIPIYPRSVKGRFRTLKWGILVLAYGVYFLLPWLRWERAAGPDQAVLFDIEARLFHLFGLTVHPQDIFWLAGFLMIAALLLFFVTGIAGRAFCGYFCFQTLWTDVFQLVERLVQGERPARMRLDKAPWGAGKLFKKGMTHALWLVVAFITGFTFTLYWGNAPDLVVQFFTGEAPFPAYATALFLTATTYVMAGLAREQVCTYMCPYARFQSVMFDQDTLIVGYDRSRGEGAGGRRKLGRGFKTQAERQAQGAGDCVDCGYCVQVCPTGIDIRNGLQMECISCALCVDACDTIMDNLGWERGLIRYASERSLRGGQTRLAKPKTLAYGLVLGVATGWLVWSVATQSELDVSVQQIRQPLSVVLSDGRIQNSYDIRLDNKADARRSFAVRIQGLPDAELDLGRVRSIEVGPHQSLTVRARVRMPRDPAAAQLPFHFIVKSTDAPVATGRRPPYEHAAHFSMPRPSGG